MRKIKIKTFFRIIKPILILSLLYLYLNSYTVIAASNSQIIQKVKAINISKVTVEKLPNLIYTGEEIKPKLTVKYGKKVLKLNTDYTVKYKNNINTGKATAIIIGKATGKGGYIYTGSKTVTFNIVKRSTISMNVNGKEATVISNSVKYKATGYKEVNLKEKSFKIDKEFTAKFRNKISNFNKITFNYVSDEPVKIKVTYKIGEKWWTEIFRLEATKKEKKSGLLIEKYSNGTIANQLIAISASTCTGKTGKFFIYDVTTTQEKLVNKTNYYIENDRYKIGVDFGKGGALTYIEDKKDNIKELTNLVNTYDEGRLVQQSYYGTDENKSYNNGTYTVAGNDTKTKWPYNPVQAGDQYGNRSRLINFKITDNYIYIKAQPLDWALNNKLTPSYMENKYTITQDTIKVDSRFVDFSGYEHKFERQELPAFFTVSYLSRFTWYDGNLPWQNDNSSLFSNDNIGWSSESKTIKLKNDNTETWCSWTSPKSKFGIGLYVPNIDYYVAGKYKYNNSANASAESTNYVAPTNIMRINSYKPITYSYLITTGTVEQIRNTFNNNKDFANNKSLHYDYKPMRLFDKISFDKKENVSLISSKYNTDVSYSTENKAIEINSTGIDPRVIFDYTGGSPLDASKYNKISIVYMIPKENKNSSYSCQFYTCTGNTLEPSETDSFTENFIKDGKYHTLEIDLSSKAFWKGEIHQIRFDYFNTCEKCDKIYLRSFKLL